MDQFIRNARYGLRVIRRTPVFAAAAILSLAVGIGANAAIFQLIDAVGFRSLPVADPDALVEVRADGVQAFGVSTDFNAEVTHPLWEQMRAHQTAFASIFAWGDATFVVGRGAEARPARGLWVSGEFFQALGISPERGRLLTPDDDRRGCGNGAAIVSHAFWQNVLGGHDAVVGSAVTVFDRPFTIVGVAPARFTGLEVGRSFDVILPLCASALWSDGLDRRDLWWLRVMGRLNPGLTIPQADSYLRALSPGLLEATVPQGYGTDLMAHYRAFRFGVMPAGRGVSRLRGRYGTSLWLLFGLTGLVLLITCTNLATLTLARAAAREREIAVRLVVGASRFQVVSQVLIESLLVAGAGAVLAVPAALFAGRALVALLNTPANPVVLDLAADARLIVFVGALLALTPILFGVIPALMVSVVNPIAVMRRSARGSTVDRHHARFQRGLVAGQVAVSVVLVVSAVLFVRTFRNLTRVETGLELEGTAAVRFIDHEAAGVPLERRVAFQQRLADEIASIPDVAGVASSTFIPLAGGSWYHFFRVPGLDGVEQQASRFTYVSPGYFDTLRIPILAGRGLTASDNAASRRVMLVNERFVESHLRGLNPIGARIRTVAEAGYPETTYEIIGVVGNTKYADVREEMPPIAYVPIAQDPDLQPWAPVIVRARVPAAAISASIVERVRRLNPSLAVQVTDLKSQVREGLTPERTTAWLAGAFGGLAIIMVTIGLYGIIAFLAAGRTREIGIRISLGSTRAQILRLLLGDSLWLLATGVFIGVPVAIAAMRGASTLLFGLSPTDLTTMAAGTILVTAPAGLAASIPAWRAARLSPDVALRSE